MAKISEVMQSIAKSAEGEDFKKYLKIVRDATLMSETPEMTAYRVGQRDLAIELLDFMEGVEDE